MKKLILFLLLVASSALAAPVTNQIVNIITITSTNSPVEVGFYLEAGKWMATNANPQAFTHSFFNYNPNNSLGVLRNTAADGFARFTIKDWAGVDASTIGSDAGGSNVVIHSFASTPAYIKLTGFGGSAGNEFIFNTLVSTNTKELVVGTRMTTITNQATIYKVGATEGFTGSVTNLGPVLGSSNVMVFATGVMTNKFTIP